MTSTRLRLAAAVSICVLALGVPAAADTITIDRTGADGVLTFDGAFTNDNDVALIVFDILSPSLFSAMTTSYALGGFDPLLTLFDGDGNWLMDNDDDPTGATGSDARLLDPITIAPLQLTPGQYTLALTQTFNYSGLTLSEPFAQTDFPSYWRETFDPEGACPAFIAVDFESGAVTCVSNTFAGSLTITPLEQPQPVPEPGTLALLATGAAAALLRRSRRRTTV